jgi:hypothetical protein
MAMEATDLSKIAAGHDVRGLVVNATLETSGAPVHKLPTRSGQRTACSTGGVTLAYLDGLLGLGSSDGGLHISGDDITAVPWSKQLGKAIRSGQSHTKEILELKCAYIMQTAMYLPVLGSHLVIMLLASKTLRHHVNQVHETGQRTCWSAPRQSGSRGRHGRR